MNRRLLTTLFVGLGLLALPASAPAVNVAVGIGDQNASMFANPSYQALNLTKTRYFIRWNAIDDPQELAKADGFVSAARADGVKVLMHVSTDNLSPKKAKLPSARAYAQKVKKLYRRYKPMGVTEWGAWNEVNHDTQPTYKSAKRAAQFYLEMRKFCTKCKIVALDVLDQSGVEGYIKRWFAAAGSKGRSAKIIGIHNYSEVNRKIKKGTNRYPGTARIIKAVRKKNKKAKFWYTETGGLAFFGSFECNPQRQADTTKYMFTLAKRYDKDVERLYSYNWTGTDCSTRFDAGLVKADGSPRPAYNVFKSNLSRFKR